MKIKLHNLIFLGMALGVAVGVGLWAAGGDNPDQPWIQWTVWTFDLIGKTMFVGSLKMLVAPLIFASVVAGITSLPSGKALGSIGLKTFAYYLCTTTIAVLIGLVLVHIIQPGKWDASQAIARERSQEIQVMVDAMGDPAKENALTKEQRSKLDRFKKINKRKRGPSDFVRDIIGTTIQNPFKSLSTGSALGIIFFAILLGVACIAVGEPAAPVVSFFQGLNAVIMKLTVWVMVASPVAIFCLMASLIRAHGPEVFETLGGYVLTVLLGIGLHICVLLAICKYVGKKSPIEYLKGMRDALAIAFSTRSSAATLPVTMDCVEENLGVPKEVSEFVLPIGATVNMDGTALYEGVAIIFLLQMFGGMPDVMVSMGAVVTIFIFITAVLASVGAAAIPDAGLITMVLVANAVGLPEYYLVFIFSVDAFLDMFRTTTNVMGDSIGAVVIHRILSGREPAEGQPL